MNDHGLYAGTFDPMTLGHLDLVERAARIFKRLTVAVAREHVGKPAPLSPRAVKILSAERRKHLRNLAKIKRLEQLAAQSNKATLKAKCAKLRALEAKRHAGALAKVKHMARSVSTHPAALVPQLGPSGKPAGSVPPKGVAPGKLGAPKKPLHAKPLAPGKPVPPPKPAPPKK